MRDDAHPQPPFTIIYSHLCGEERREERNANGKVQLLNPDEEKGAELQNAVMRNSRRAATRASIFD